MPRTGLRPDREYHRIDGPICGGAVAPPALSLGQQRQRGGIEVRVERLPCVIRGVVPVTP
jgi:hypothetical protein